MTFIEKYAPAGDNKFLNMPVAKLGLEKGQSVASYA
jgi:hypothetical protein